MTGICVALASLATVDRIQGKCRAFTDTVGEEIDRIMIGAAETSHFVDSIKLKIEQDVQTTNDIVHSAERNAGTTEQIAANAERAARVAAEVRTLSVSGRAEVDRGLSQISEAQRNADSASEKMAVLQKTARRIQSIADIIHEVANNTNLLALNAAIEAARAGEHGRGFSIVAGEVRQLAQRTKTATDDIALMVRDINTEAERVATDMAELVGKVAEATYNVKSVHGVLANIEQAASLSGEEIKEIAAASRENARTTSMITRAISRIRDNMLSTQSSLPRATHSAMTLAERAETIFEALANSGARTEHDEIRAAAEAAAAHISKLFDEAIAQGQISEEALFDRNYRPIANTAPQKFSTRFDALTDRLLPAIQEKLLADMPQLTYAGAVDNNGYFPTHNRKFSQPLTGNFDIDLLNNRTKRIFDDRTGSRCGSHTKSFLLQTYKRDTGEVMHDLSVPIFVAGKHWGGFRIGYRSSMPMAKPEAAACVALLASPA